MNRLYKYCSTILFLTLMYLTSQAQSADALSQPFYLGKCETVLKELNRQFTIAMLSGNYTELELKIPGVNTLKAKIQFKHSHRHPHGVSQYISGEIKNLPASRFYLSIKSTRIEGLIVLQATRQAYKYYSDEQGNAYVCAVDINTVKPSDKGHITNPLLLL